MDFLKGVSMVVVNGRKSRDAYSYMCILQGLLGI